LGPENADGLYDYSIVSDKFNLYLFVLARDPVVFKEKYDAEVQTLLQEYGFKGWKAPIPTYHGDDCIYESERRSIQIKESELKSLEVSAAPETVSELDVTAYLGRWYQYYADRFVLATFQRDSYCVTADYNTTADGKISVHNYETVGAPDGTPKTIDGYAYVADPSEPGKLTVHLDGTNDAPYWVLALGPKNADGLYDWSIVSEESKSFLFVLARDTHTFEEKYKTSVDSLLVDLGFTGFLNSPILIDQSSTCVYEN